MTEQEKQQLSLDVAEKLGISAWFIYEDRCEKLWLYQNSASCFDLMVEHYIEVAYTKHVAVAYYHLRNCVQVPFNPYPTKQEATRIAILKSLLALVSR
jgi:hypothetical protein